MIGIERLQAYLRHSAQQQYEAVRLSPFTLFCHPEDAFPHFNYAIPDEPVTGDVAGPLAEVRAACAARGRLPRFEFVEAFAPELGAQLAAAGFVLEGRFPFMLCTPQTWQAAPAVTGLTATQVGPDAPLGDVRDVVMVQQRGFGVGDELPTEEEAERFRLLLRHNVTFLGRMDEQAVCVASYSMPYDGLAEIAGIATIPSYRRRGLASALTSLATQAAFAQGASAVFLSAADERAGRLYQRLGFQPFAHLLAYRQPDLAANAAQVEQVHARQVADDDDERIQFNNEQLALNAGQVADNGQAGEQDAQ